MKKTFTINIGYSIFNIEEGAYEVLNSYLNSIKTYFSTIDNDSEIIKDFELRVAENFSSKISSSKQCINLNDVREMIQIMGSLDDFKEIYSDNGTETTNEDKKSNKLFRDSSNRIIAGICSGIAEYFKIDPIIIRIIFFIAVPLNLIIYIILWMGIPSKDFDPNLRKILYRDKENGIFGGVAKGLSNYLKIDVNIIRVVFVVSLFFGGAGLMFYLLLFCHGYDLLERVPFLKAICRTSISAKATYPRSSVLLFLIMYRCFVNKSSQSMNKSSRVAKKS